MSQGFKDILGLCGGVFVVSRLQEEDRGCPVPVTATSSHLCSRFSVPELSLTWGAGGAAGVVLLRKHFQERVNNTRGR